LTAELSRAEAVPAFTAPGPPLNIASLRGKKIFVIPFASSPQNVAIDTAMQQVGAKTGIQVSVCNNHGTPSEWSQCLQQALSTKQDLVVMNAAPAVLAPQLEALKAAKIPVLSAHYFPEGVTPTDPACTGCSAGVSAVQPAPFAQSARLMADWTISDSNGKADVLVTVIPGFAPTDAMESQFKAEFARCPGCKYKLLPVTVADVLGSGFGTAVSSALNADPNVDYVIDEVDLAVPATVAALNLAGRKHVKIAAFSGTVGALQEMEKNGPVAMDAGEPGAWIGYESMDDAFRMLLGKPPYQGPTPVRVFTPANVRQAGAPPSATEGYGSGYVSGYMKLWGLG
jgi:ribose transport system substrate-binding protein